MPLLGPALASVAVLALGSGILAAAPAASAMNVVGSLPLAGNTVEVVASGNTLFAASENGGLHVIDATDPSLPVPLATVPFPFGANGVDVVPGWAFVGAGLSGLAAVNVANPAAPGAPVFLALGGIASDVLVVGSVAYVVSPSYGVHVVDVANPAAPVFVQTLSLLFPSRLRLSGTHLLVSGATSGLAVYDVSTPLAPVLVGSRNVPGGTDFDATVLGSLLVTLGAGTMNWLDLSQPATLPTVFSAGSAGATAFAREGSLLVSARGSLGIRLTDISGVTPPLPGAIGSLVLPGAALKMRVANGHAFIASGFEGLRVVSVANPTAPAEVGSVFVGNAQSVDVAGNLAVVGEEIDGLRLFDVSSPASPVYLGTADTPGTPRAIRIAGTRAYVADGPSGLRIVDVSIPTAPSLLGGIHSGNATDVEVHGTDVYLVDGVLRIFDAANPAFPIQRFAYTPPSGPATAVALAWPLAYVSTATATHVLEVSQPASPALLATIAAGGAEVEISGRTLYVSKGTGTTIVDVSAPALPVVRTIHSGMPAADLERLGSLLFTLPGTGADDLRIFDALLPPGGKSPREIQSLATTGSAGNVTIDPARELVYVAQQGAGIALVSIASDLAANACVNGRDDDGDGLVDYPADGGCSLWGDPSEKGDCEDGLDNDGDGLVDHPADPGCRNAQPGSIESPQCNDGADNDGDGQTDFPADAFCAAAWDDDELANPPPACGLLGIEALLALPFAAIGGRRRRRRGAVREGERGIAR